MIRRGTENNTETKEMFKSRYYITSEWDWDLLKWSEIITKTCCCTWLIESPCLTCLLGPGHLFQSTFPETAIIRVKNDLLSSTEQCSLSAVLLIDLRATLNTIDLRAFRKIPVCLCGISFTSVCLNFANRRWFFVFEASGLAFFKGALCSFGKKSFFG